jgi:hypothetical protein
MSAGARTQALLARRGFGLAVVLMAALCTAVQQFT